MVLNTYLGNILLEITEVQHSMCVCTTLHDRFRGGTQEAQVSFLSFTYLLSNVDVHKKTH